MERAVKAGQNLFRTGGRTAGLYEILKGKVRLVRVDRSGREAVLQVASAGETLAEASLFSSTYHCDAVAITDSVVRLIQGPSLSMSWHIIRSLLTHLRRRWRGK